MEDTSRSGHLGASLAALALWLATSAAVLCFTLTTWEPGPTSDAGVVFVCAMLLLTFPAGLLVPVLVAASLAVFGDRFVSALPAPWGFGVLWLGFVALGYWQWFKVVPGLWHRMHRRARAA